MFVKTTKHFRKSHFGQGMTEYIIIVAVIAIAAIGAFGYFGKVVEKQIAGVSQELGGIDATDTREEAGTFATESTNRADAEDNNMAQYTDNNSGEAE
jgi:Flp pilus assembly pilin Flp